MPTHHALTALVCYASRGGGDACLAADWASDGSARRLSSPARADARRRAGARADERRKKWWTGDQGAHARRPSARRGWCRVAACVWEQRKRTRSSLLLVVWLGRSWRRGETARRESPRGASPGPGACPAARRMPGGRRALSSSAKRERRGERTTADGAKGAAIWNGHGTFFSNSGRERHAVISLWP